MKTHHALLILLILFGILTAVSWKMWANPVIDSGREMSVPLRLLQGEKLYSQVYYMYGPAAPVFNALLYRVFGIHLNTLYAAGMAGSLLLVILIFHLARNLMSTFDSLLAAAAVLLLCVFKQEGNTIVPYSYAALYGTIVGTLALAFQVKHLRSNGSGSLLIAGLLAGLAFCCKMEFGFAAIASQLALILTGQSQIRAKSAWIALPSILVFPLLFYIPIFSAMPAASILRDTYILPGSLPPALIYYNKFKILGWSDPFRTLRELLSALALLLGLAGLSMLAGLSLARRSGEIIRDRMLSRRLWLLTGTGFGILLVHVLVFGTRWDLNPFRALPVFFIAMLWYCLKKKGGLRGSEKSTRLLLLFLIYGLVVLLRVIIRVPAGGAYGSVLIPVPFVLFLYMTTVDSPIFALPAEAGRVRLRTVRIMLAIGLLAAACVVAFRYAHNSYDWLRTPRGSLRQSPPITRAMSQAISFLGKNTRPGDYVLALPEGSSLNFLADRPIPLRYDILTPGFLSEQQERISICALQDRNVDVILLLNRPTPEFGAKIIGRDYYRILMGWIEENYSLKSVFGRNTALGIQIGDPDFFIKCYRRTPPTP
jgi:hypothetical protein